MRTVLLLLFTLCLAACAGSRRSERYFRKRLKPDIEASPVFSRAFTGFHLIDAATGRELCSVNADRYFIPASNTKILTLATCLKVLGDSIPGVRYTRYEEISDTAPLVQTTISFRGTGDPTFLHPAFQAWQPVHRMLLSADHLEFDHSHMKEARFGPGWSWDDFGDAYSAERASMPVYGNLIRLRLDSKRWLTEPGYFQSFLKASSFEDAAIWNYGIHRDEASNTIFIPPDINLQTGAEITFPEGYQPDIPVFQAEQHLLTLIMGSLDTADHPISGSEVLGLGKPLQVMFSTPVDTVYRRMMHQSDNFIAEQLLLVCSGVKFDTLKQAPLMAWTKDSLFAGLPDPPRWVDGSGLSRYNLASPRFLTGLLRKLYLEQPQERLFSLFPAGGVSGTIAEWYAGPDGKPFVFAKTGSMSGVHCLSGYLKTKSGKILIFSFMHNNFTGSNKPWKAEMQRLLRLIWDRR